ncbi:Aldo/keto reductase [Atractiella rhizophila]|nr:Aldo/keto reductase [Atractiella rhizophila]
MSNKVPVDIVFGGGAGYHSIDTAASYGPSEGILGDFKAGEKGWIIDTKAEFLLPNFDTYDVKPGAHNLESLRKSLESSLQKLGVSKVRTFYLHVPDRSTPILETLKAVDILYREGKFDKFGLSNHSATDVEEFIKLAEQHSLVKVSVYTGVYNGLARTPETELFPLLRKHNISFFAFSPTAGGFFQEKHIVGLDAPGRHAAFFLPPRAIRWLVYHSGLKGEIGDAVILGANGESQLQEGLQWVDKGPLDQWAMDAMDDLWEVVKDVAPPYNSGF